MKIAFLAAAILAAVSPTPSPAMSYASHDADAPSAPAPAPADDLSGALLEAPAAAHRVGPAQPGFNDVAGSMGPVSLDAVPEPATWTLLAIGFGIVGSASRRRQVASVAA